MPDENLLRTSLNLAVPMWVFRLSEVPLDDLVRRAPDLGQFIGEKGDIMQFKSKKKGESANAFNKLAEGIAILSFMPGGVTFLGDHYENTHPDREAPPDPHP